MKRKIMKRERRKKNGNKQTASDFFNSFCEKMQRARSKKSRSSRNIRFKWESSSSDVEMSLFCARMLTIWTPELAEGETNAKNKHKLLSIALFMPSEPSLLLLIFGMQKNMLNWLFVCFSLFIMQALMGMQSKMLFFYVADFLCKVQFSVFVRTKKFTRKKHTRAVWYFDYSLNTDRDDRVLNILRNAIFMMEMESSNLDEHGISRFKGF